MAEERLNPRSERTRAALIGAGRRLFSERPVDAVTVDDIVAAAGVGKGSFYNHFEDREALVRAISGGIRASIEGAVGRANAEISDPALRLARAVCIYLRYAVDEPEPARVLVRIHSGHTSLSAPLNRGLVDDISNGLAQGAFHRRDPGSGCSLCAWRHPARPGAGDPGYGRQPCRQPCTADVRASVARSGPAWSGSRSDRRSSQR